MGEDYKVLIYASNDKPMKRQLYLLDKSNLIVDEMKVDAAQSFVKVNDSIFSPIDIGDAIMIQIKDRTLNVKEAYEFYRPAKHGINTANVFLNPDTMIGTDYVNKDEMVGTQIYLIDRPEKRFVNPNGYHEGYDYKKNPPFDYGSLAEEDTTVIFQPSGSMIGKSDESLFRHYAYKNGISYVWISTHKTLLRLEKDGNIRRSRVPIPNDNTEMKMYFDNVMGEVYLVSWESGLPEGERVYTLHQITENNELRPLLNLYFFPMVIDNGYLYEGRKGRKSFEVYRYPLKGQVPEKVVPFGFEGN
jgi:hypothetical protein